MHTGEVIRHMRKKKNLTQQELADILGVRKSSVQKYENGSVQNLKLETLQKLCKVFKTSPYAFVFPETWENIRVGEGINEFDQYAMVAYFNLTHEGKEKVLNYVQDLGEIKKYRNTLYVPLETHWLYSKEDD